MLRRSRVENAFRGTCPSGDGKGIDFSVEAITVLWQDGAPSAKQAFHYNSPGLSVTCKVCLLRRYGIFSSPDQMRLHSHCNFKAFSFFFFFGQRADFRLGDQWLEKRLCSDRSIILVETPGWRQGKGLCAFFVSLPVTSLHRRERWCFRLWRTAASHGVVTCG